jgi:hypothetical protein
VRPSLSRKDNKYFFKGAKAMLKQATLAFLFCLTGSIANAQVNNFTETSKSVVCDDARKVVSLIMERYKEIPMWTAQDGDKESRYMLLANPDTGSWTLLQYTPQVACVLGVGTGSKLATDKNLM